VYVDIYTGELVSGKELNDRGYAVPVVVSEITSREKYKQVVEDRLKINRYRLQVSHVLLDLVTERQLSIPALSVFCYLGQNIGYNNMVFTTIKDIQEGSGYTRQCVSDAIQELKKNDLVREVEHKLENKADRFFLISPVFFFLGYYPYRDNLIRSWIKGN
jgi:hypothetical protein